VGHWIFGNHNAAVQRRLTRAEIQRWRGFSPIAQRWPCSQPRRRHDSFVALPRKPIGDDRQRGRK
jgi:hypothetical protein